MNAEKLKETLYLHKKWCNGEKGGERANLRDADLRMASLRGASLRGASLRCADLRYADLSGANLRGADLRDADLRGADLRDANLSYANLRDANLSYADLRDADLRGADLRDADLRGVIGIKYAQCSFAAHGECGRTLICIVIDGTPTYFCGCFRGTFDQLSKYIANGDEEYKESRTLAVEFVTKAAAMERKMT